ncbi:hypothetical protein HYN24_11760 [Dechloromonas sp. HYN0024]|nr:hypothetical protein HYN24_11760 [Dechloromonas sp. HYN0024]
MPASLHHADYRRSNGNASILVNSLIAEQSAIRIGQRRRMIHSRHERHRQVFTVGRVNHPCTAQFPSFRTDIL